MAGHDVGGGMLCVGSFQFKEGHDAFLQEVTEAEVECVPFLRPVQRGRVTPDFTLGLYEEFSDVLFGIGE